MSNNSKASSLKSLYLMLTEGRRQEVELAAAFAWFFPDFQAVDN